MSLALIRSCLGLFSHLCPHSFFHISYHFTIILVCPTSCCSHARGILREIHTSCMGSQFPAVHARWSIVFRSSVTSSQRLRLLQASYIIIIIIIVWGSCTLWERFHETHGAVRVYLVRIPLIAVSNISLIIVYANLLYSCSVSHLKIYRIQLNFSFAVFLSYSTSNSNSRLLPLLKSRVSTKAHAFNCPPPPKVPYINSSFYGLLSN